MATIEEQLIALATMRIVVGFATLITLQIPIYKCITYQFVHTIKLLVRSRYKDKRICEGKK